KEENKYYVVWKGLTPGIYKNWNDCKKQINGFEGAKYKGFKKYETAIEAFKQGPEDYWGKDFVEIALTKEQLIKSGSPIKRSFSVDAAWNVGTLEMEYQGVMTDSGEVLFHKGPFQDATNNTGEFL